MIIKAERNGNYTTMSNHHLKDRNLSLKAKGLLSMILSLPESWTYSIKGLVSISKESRLAIENALKELQENHYLWIEKLYPDKSESHKIEYIYHIYEIPYGDIQDTDNQDLDNQALENPYLENQDLDNQALESQHLLNTKELNTNKTKTKELNTKDKYESLDAIVDDRYKDTLKAFIKMRKSIKKPITDYGLKLIINKLDKMTTNNDEKIAILEQSIMNSWQGVFPLKNQGKNIDDRYKGIMEWGNE